ncbi:MAG: hypothetical protein APF76_04885 [Desulfitibacter sp. BRH_c19]|nr:MAG: hypothetical protein APF76_04885 [Desulfitibacter sp. BRH_c19]
MEDLKYQTGYGLTEKHYNLLKDEAKKNNIKIAVLVRKILTQMLNKKQWLDTLIITSKLEEILKKKTVISLNKDIFDKICLLVKEFNISRSAIIRRAIEDYFEG